MYGEGLAPCGVNLTCWPAAWTSSSSRPLDAQPDRAGSVSVNAPNHPQPAAVMVTAQPGATVRGYAPAAAASAVETGGTFPSRTVRPGRPSNQLKR